MSNNLNAKSVIGSEYLFIFLPLIIIAIVRSYNENLYALLEAPDLSFAASILWGQTLVRLVSGSVSTEQAQWQQLSFLISIIIVLGIAPSLTILILVLVSSSATTFLVSIQLIWFFLGTIAFFFFGIAGQAMLQESSSRN